MNYSDALISGQGITLSEALSAGGMVTVTGMGIVFGVLVILMIVLLLFKVIFGRSSAKKETKKVENVQASPAESPVEEDTVDDSELVAILTAAVAASLNTSTYNLKIKSYRRVDNKMTAWNKAGLTETINNRF